MPKAKKGGLLSKLKFDSHHRMERFIALFSFLSVVMVGVVGYATIVHIEAQNNQLGSKAVYTKKVKTSKTDVDIDVVNVYASKDKTKAFLLLKTDSPDKISANAENYMAFLTGADIKGHPNMLKSQPSGSIYVFGTSGYMGVYLVANEGFPTQILKLTIRSGVELTEAKKTSSDDAKRGESYSKYDQFDVFFNPGASDASDIECLDSDKAPSKFALYNQTVVRSEMKRITDTLTADVESMRLGLNKINEFNDRLGKTDNMQVPETPKVIAGDTITKNSDGTYDMHFKSIVPGGYDFDWMHGDIEHGWLDDLIKKTDTPTMTYDQYFAMQISARKLGDKNNSMEGLSNIKWTLKDGTALESLNTGANNPKYVAINKDCQNLINAWRNYYQAKNRYQTDGLEEILNLEVTAKHVQESASVNTSDTAIKLY